MGIFIILVVGLLLHFFHCSSVGAESCPNDAVQVGPLCVDKYEASVWVIQSDDPKDLKDLKELAQSGRATKDRLVKLGANQVGETRVFDAIDNYPCSDNGND